MSTADISADGSVGLGGGAGGSLGEEARRLIDLIDRGQVAAAAAGQAPPPPTPEPT